MCQVLRFPVRSAAPGGFSAGFPHPAPTIPGSLSGTPCLLVPFSAFVPESIVNCTIAHVRGRCQGSRSCHLKCYPWGAVPSKENVTGGCHGKRGTDDGARAELSAPFPCGGDCYAGGTPLTSSGCEKASMPASRPCSPCLWPEKRARMCGRACLSAKGRTS